VKVATAGRSGKLVKTVMVMTDDPVTPSAQLTVSANITVDLDLERPYLMFPPLRKGEGNTQRVAILVKDPAAFKAGGTTSSLDDCAAKVTREEKAEQEGKPSWGLDVTCGAKAIGDFAGTVTVKVLAPKETELVLSVSGRVDGDIIASPTVLSLYRPGSTAPGDVTNSVTLRSVKGKFKVLKVEDKEGMTAAKVETVLPGMEYRLVVSLSEKGKAAETFSSTLVVKTSAKDQAVITIPVHYITGKSTGMKGPGAGAFKQLAPSRPIVSPKGAIPLKGQGVVGGEPKTKSLSTVPPGQ